MKYFSLIFLSYIFSACTPGNPTTQSDDFFYMPAEYEEHEAVWLGWQDFPPYKQPYLDLTEALVDHVKIKMIANTDSSLQNLKEALLSRNIDTNKIEYHVIEDNRLWMRDHGATYLVNRLGEKEVVDFGWTAYGNYDFQLKKYEGNIDSARYYYQKTMKKTGLIDSIMGDREGYGSQKADVNMEGGSIEVNGKGTLILCERVTFQRNPDLSKKELETRFKNALGVSHIIWLPEGLADDPFHFSQISGDFYGWGTYGHTDEFVRFVDDHTVFLAWVDEAEKDMNPINRINYDRMSRNLEILEKSTDQDGNPIEVIKVPLPELTYLKVVMVEKMEDNLNVPLDWLANSDQELQIGDSILRVPASSYLNYLVTNGAVILPTYTSVTTSEEKEAVVKAIFRKAFPHRKLIFMDAMNLNYYGGGIHCITQQEPKTSTDKNFLKTPPENRIKNRYSGIG